MFSETICRTVTDRMMTNSAVVTAMTMYSILRSEWLALISAHSSPGLADMSILPTCINCYDLQLLYISRRILIRKNVHR